MRKLVLFPVLALAFACSDNALLEPPAELEANMAVVAKKPMPLLRNTIEYSFVGHLGEVDGEGRLKVWDGQIHGDIEGDIYWWFVLGGGPPNMPDAAHSSFYEARWEVWVGGALVLAGNSSGQTASPRGKDGIWRGNGIVTETSAGFDGWMGRHTYEGGNVNWTFPYSGEGIFRIN